jgi:hypothetical protein
VPKNYKSQVELIPFSGEAKPLYLSTLTVAKIPISEDFKSYRTLSTELSHNLIIWVLLSLIELTVPLKVSLYCSQALLPSNTKTYFHTTVDGSQYCDMPFNVGRNSQAGLGKSGLHVGLCRIHSLRS